MADEATHPLKKYDEPGRHGSAAHFFFSKLIQGHINVCVGEVGNSGGGAIMPAVANETTFSNIVHTTSGGSCKWLPHVDKLILEMLANRTPPTCIQANIFAMLRVLHLEIDIVRELPSVKHIKSLRMILSTVMKTLAAYQLGHAQTWKQLHTDETFRRQISIVNVVISIINTDNKLHTICMSGSIIPKDGTADEQSRAIISASHDSGHHLQEWQDMTSIMYPGEDKLLAAIPNSDVMSPTKLIGGFLSHNNCATANKMVNNLMEKILQLAKEAGMSGPELILY